MASAVPGQQSSSTRAPADPPAGPVPPASRSAAATRHGWEAGCSGAGEQQALSTAGGQQPVSAQTCAAAAGLQASVQRHAEGSAAACSSGPAGSCSRFTPPRPLHTLLQGSGPGGGKQRCNGRDRPRGRTRCSGECRANAAVPSASVGKPSAPDRGRSPSAKSRRSAAGVPTALVSPAARESRGPTVGRAGPGVQARGGSGTELRETARPRSGSHAGIADSRAGAAGPRPPGARGGRTRDRASPLERCRACSVRGGRERNGWPAPVTCRAHGVGARRPCHVVTPSARHPHGCTSAQVRADIW
jgi:hypothetical protein